MKIIYLGTADFPGGGSAGRCVHMIAKGLVNCGHEVTVLMGRRRCPGPSYEVIDGIEVHWSSDVLPDGCNSGWKRFLYVAKSRFKYAKELFLLLGKSRYDWIISYSVGIEVLIPIIIARYCYKIKVASQYGDIVLADYKAGFITAFSLNLSHILGARTSHIILNSGSKALEAQFRKLSPKVKVVSLLPPVDTKIFSLANRSDFRVHYNLHGFKLVTYIGGFKPYEGLADLVKALSPTLTNNKEIRLVIAGGMVKADFQALQNIVSLLVYKHNILFPGQLDLTDVANLLAASDVLVLPKTDHPVNHYAMPIKLGEYFASGKPVVSAAIGGITDYLEHGINGLIYKPGDLNALRMAVEELLYNDEKAKNLGLAGQKTAVQKFDIHVVASNLAEALNESAQ